jgi:hypothetical protein
VEGLLVLLVLLLEMQATEACCKAAASCCYRRQLLQAAGVPACEGHSPSMTFEHECRACIFARRNCVGGGQISWELRT